MLRILVLAAILYVVAVLILRPRSLKRTLYVLGALAVVYTVLKLTGAIEAIAPDRTGVF
jgi:hypothetical protein